MNYKGRKLLRVAAAAIMVTVVLSITACGKKNDDGKDLNNDEYCPSSSVALDEEAAAALNENIRFAVYFLGEDGKTLEGEIRNMKIEEAKKSTAVIATNIIEELLKGPSEGSKFKRMIPEGTKLLEQVKISGDIAVVNLSKEFIEKNDGDKTSVEMCIYSLVNSVTEIKELDKVKILIDGKEQKDFKGLVKMDLAFKRNKSLISIKSAQTAQTIADQEEEANTELDDVDEILE